MIRALTVLTIALLSSTPALAQEEACSGYTNIELSEALARAQEALDKMNIARATRSVAQAHAKLRCLDEPIEISLFANFARYKSLMAFFDQDEALSTQWATASLYADPDLAWPEGYQEGHPFRTFVEEDLEDVATGRVQGAFLNIPSKGAVLLGGRILWEPMAPSETPLLVQTVDRKGNVLSTAWQDGAAFTDSLLSPEPTTDLKAPRWYSGPVPEIPDSLIGQKKPLQVKKLITTGSMVLVSGTLYALAASSRATLDADMQSGVIQTNDELAAKRGAINMLVIGSGATGLVAVGGGVSLMVDSPTLGFGFRF